MDKPIIVIKGCKFQSIGVSTTHITNQNKDNVVCYGVRA